MSAEPGRAPLRVVAPDDAGAGDAGRDRPRRPPALRLPGLGGDDRARRGARGGRLRADGLLDVREQDRADPGLGRRGRPVGRRVADARGTGGRRRRPPSGNSRRWPATTGGCSSARATSSRWYARRAAPSPSWPRPTATAARRGDETRVQVFSSWPAGVLRPGLDVRVRGRRLCGHVQHRCLHHAHRRTWLVTRSESSSGGAKRSSANS